MAGAAVRFPVRISPRAPGLRPSLSRSLRPTPRRCRRCGFSHFWSRESVHRASTAGPVSRFCVAWIRKTISNVTIVVPALMTSCQVSPKPNKGPVKPRQARRRLARGGRRPAGNWRGRDGQPSEPIAVWLRCSGSMAYRRVCARPSVPCQVSISARPATWAPSELPARRQPQQSSQSSRSGGAFAGCGSARSCISRAPSTN